MAKQQRIINPGGYESVRRSKKYGSRPPYRADYASAWYKRLARPAAFIPPADRYVCRRDRAGVVYDKAAMLQVSRMLGHNRISVIAGHYLHD